MKKPFIFIAFLWLWTSSSFSQSNYPEWPQSGAEWGVCFYNHGHMAPTSGGPAFDMSHEKDTTIGTQDYKVVERITPHYYPEFRYFFRYSNDTVYRWINGQDYLFFTYNINLGDTISILRTGIEDYNQDTCGLYRDLKLVGINLVNLDSETLTEWKFEQTSQPIFNGNNTFKWTEKLGWFSNFPWLTDHQEYVCAQPTMHMDELFIYSYEDSSTNINLPCADYSSISEEKINHQEITIYPNPANKAIFIQFPNHQEYTIIITNLQGKEMHSQVQKNGKLTTEIDVNSLSNGVYLIIVEKENGAMFQKKWVKQ